jgi:hypothetical protein
MSLSRIHLNTDSCKARLNLRLHFRQGARRVDHANAPGLRLGELEIACPHAPEKRACLALETVAITAAGLPLCRHLQGHIQQQAQVRTQLRQ